MLSIGIVGLPNVGKSTLFRALTRKQVAAENFPFCTIDPNVGVVSVPDSRLDTLTELSKSQKTIATAIEFVDIAGLVAGAHKGEGLGNKFLTHIREVDAICHVVRAFEDPNIIDVNNKVAPDDDRNTIHLELVLADLEVAQKRLSTLQSQTKGGVDKETKFKLPVYEKVVAHLESERMLTSLELTDEEKLAIKESSFLTIKPMMYVVNVAESEVNKQFHFDGIEDKFIVPLCIKLEADLVDLPPAEVTEYLETLGLKFTGLERLIRTGYELLNLITYFTTGEKETRAWTVTRGNSAPVAAGKIHSDFEKGFITAETVAYEKLVEAGSWSASRERGFLRIEGKVYIVQDGDVMIFHFQ